MSTRKLPPPAAPAARPDKPSAPDILAALDDRELFAPHFRGETWQAWRAFLAALFALPMTAAEAAIFRERTGRTTPPTEQFAEAALIVGRRGGKSRVLAMIAVFLAAFRDYDEHLAPGEVATIGVLAANRSQARSIFRFALGLLKAVPLLAPLVEDDNTESITLRNRVVIEISTASFRTTRGYSYAAVLADEIAFWRQDETSANPDVEILRALRPGMASIPGSILLLASSPYAKRGALYAAFRRHYGQDDARVLVWKADTAAMNPRIDPEIIAEAYEDDPEAARAEYGAEFRDDLADFVTRETVDAVTMTGRTELPPMPGVVYSAFCDPSGGASDAMTLAIGHMQAGAVAVLDAVRETRPPFDPEQTVAEYATLLRRFGINHVIGDRYGGEWPRQRFREHGIAYDPSARPKSDLYIDLLPLLNAGRVELLDLPRLSAQLVGLERRTARSGRDSVDHTPGGHDDIANAVAGVLVGLDLDRRPALIRTADMLTDGAGLPMPARADYIFAVLSIAADGMAAGAYFAYTRHAQPPRPPLMLLDFDLAHFAGATIPAMASRLVALSASIATRSARLVALIPAAVIPHAARAGVHAEPIPEAWLADVPGLALSAAANVAAGRFKLSAIVQAKAAKLPLGGALDFRTGDTAADADPLRQAVLLGCAMALDPTATPTPPPIRSARLGLGPTAA